MRCRKTRSRFQPWEWTPRGCFPPPTWFPACRAFSTGWWRRCPPVAPSICISERWRAVLPSVQIGFSAEFVANLDASGAGEYVCELAYRRGGFVTFRNVLEMAEPLPAFPGGRFEQFRQALAGENIRNLTAVSLQTREHNFGVVLFPHAERRLFGASNLRLLIGLALQIGLTLENYVVMHDAQRRTKEYQLLTQIGQAISSRLESAGSAAHGAERTGADFRHIEFLRRFPGRRLDCASSWKWKTDSCCREGTRKVDNGLTEYILRTGQPLLIRSDLEQRTRAAGRNHHSRTGPRNRSVRAPILVNGRATGVMAAMSTDREYIFEPRDLDVLQDRCRPGFGGH